MGRPKAGAFETETPERLLRSAEQEFARSGLRGSRLEDIARRAGIRRPSLLYHYPTKEALYARVVRRAFARLGRTLLEAMTEEADFARSVERTAAAFERALTADPSLASLILRELLDGHGPGRAILLEEMVPLLDQVELFVRQHGRRRIRPGLPIRAAILQGASDILLRAASGPLRDPLWGRGAAASLARLLFLRR